ncbi:MAG: protein kinase [Deltaproteobacteria bacterium]|nr:protein kinase [Deltaproteobacteria bacterium]
MRGAPAEMVLGRYRIEHPIGRGGFGRIYLATQTSLNRKVAIKASSEENRDDAAMRERFRREALLVASINHPHVVTYHEFGVDADGDLVLVMEYLKGLSLFELLKRRHAVSLEETVGYITQACEGLGAANEAGIVHRDVKPSNLFVVDPGTRRERLKVIDFGILRADPKLQPGLRDLTRTDHVIGTPAYLAPEMLLGGAIDGRADQYALALVAVELFTGRRVFGGGSGSEGIMARMDGTAPDIRGIAPGMPAGVRRVLGRALARDPDERFPDMHAFANALNAEVHSEPTTSTVVDVPEVVRPRKKHPSFVAAAVTVMAAGAFIAWMAVSYFDGSATGGSTSVTRPQILFRTDTHPIVPTHRRGVDDTSVLVSSASNTRKAVVRHGRASRTATPKAIHASGHAVMTLNARPWAEVFLDGRNLGRTPIIGLDTTAGRHVVVFRHPELGERTYRRDLEDGQVFNLTANLSAGGPRDARRGSRKQPHTTRLQPTGRQ